MTGKWFENNGPCSRGNEVKISKKRKMFKKMRIWRKRPPLTWENEVKITITKKAKWSKITVSGPIWVPEVSFGEFCIEKCLTLMPIAIKEAGGVHCAAAVQQGRKGQEAPRRQIIASKWS